MHYLYIYLWDIVNLMTDRYFVLISSISTHIFSLSTKLLLSCPVVQGTVVAGGGNGNGNGYGGGGGGGISCGHATEIHTLPAVSGTGKCSTHTVTAIAARHTCTRMPGKTGIWGFGEGKKKEESLMKIACKWFLFLCLWL